MKSMIRRLALCGAAMVMSLPAFAFSQFPMASDTSYQGGYVGVSTAYQSSKRRVISFDPQVDPPLFFDEVIVGKNNNLSVGAFAGYGAVFFPWYLAAEVGSQFRSDDRLFTIIQEQDVPPDASASELLTIQSLVTMDLLPGFVVSGNHFEALLFMRAGVELAYMRYKQYNNDLPTFTKRKYGRPGLRLGLGGEWLASETIGFRLNYIYTYYFKTTFEGRTVIPGPINRVWETKPRTQEVRFDLVYHFNGGRR